MRHEVVARAVRKRDSASVDQSIRRRLKFSLFTVVLLLAALFGWVALHQTVWRSELAEASFNQRTRVSVMRAERGTIFDRNGNEIALSVPSVTVFADPQEVTDSAGTAAAIGAILQWTPERIADFTLKLEDKSRAFVYVARQLDESVAGPVLALDLPGVGSYSEPRREVSSGVAGAIVGQTDPDGVGISGLEEQYNGILTGRDGKSIRQRDEEGNSISVSLVSRAVPGDDLVLTIDKSLQFMADQALVRRVEQLRARGGTIVIMDVDSGEIYAISNVRRDEEGIAKLASANFAAVEAYEPGSVAKVFSVSAAMNEGMVTPETSFVVPGVWNIDGFRIADAYPHGPLNMNVREILRSSSNIGTTMTAHTITTTRLHEYLTAFGFGQRTGLGFPNETNGILNKASRWYGTTSLTIPYGYGFASSPLQLIAGVNTVANGGVYVAPKLVKGVVDSEGIVRDEPPSESRTVLTPETATSMTEMLANVVCNGTGQQAQTKGTTVAGKTGTGYKAQDNGTYLSDKGNRKYFASFVGYFPANDPQITILVSIDEPDASSRDRFGSTAAAPLFSRLATLTMNQLRMTPTVPGTGCGVG